MNDDDDYDDDDDMRDDDDDDVGYRPLHDTYGEVTEEEQILPKITSGSSDMILAALFRSIMTDLRITRTKFNTLMSDFINNPVNGIEPNRKARSSERGNLTRVLSKESLSWKVFCKGLRFLNIRKFEIHIVAYHANGKQTVHSKTVNLASNPVPIPINNDRKPGEKS